MDCGQLLLDTLSFSDPDEFRQRLDNLKHKHRRADKQLQQLVAQHQHELLSVMHVYDSVAQRIAATRGRISRVRHNLTQCKQLLHCRRHELKQLWQAGMEQRCMLTLLDTVDHLRQLPEAVSGSLRAGRLYWAAHQLTDGLRRFERQQLGCLRALHETRLELDALVVRLHGQLTDRLHGFLFGRHVETDDSGAGVGRAVRGSTRSSTRREPARELAGVVVGDKVSTDDLCQLHERLNSGQLSALETSGDGGRVGRLLLVLESLILLGKLSDTMETLYGRTNGELLLLVSRVTREVVAGEARGSDQLEQLVASLGKQLLSIGDTHERVLALLRKLAPADAGSMLYTGETMWQRIQETLQRVFTEYLESSATAQSHDDKASVLVAANSTADSAAGDDETDIETADLSSYFMRKRVTRSSPSQLFTFQNSSTSLDMVAYLQEKCQREGGGTIARDRVTSVVAASSASVRVRLPLKCHPFNIKWLYPCFLRLAGEIEVRNTGDTPSSSNKACSLRIFINDYINDILLHRLRIEGQQLVERRIDNWQQMAAAVLLEKEGAGSALPLLHSVWQVEQFVAALHQLIPVLTAHANHLLSVVCAALVQFKEAAAAQLLFMSRCSVPGSLTDTEEPVDPGVVLSASWARDADISRFLRELSDWQQQKQRSVDGSGGGGGDHVFCRTVSEDVSMEHTPDRRYQRETELLTANLDDKQLPSASDMLDDERVWRQLAHFHHSVQYIAISVGRRTGELRSGSNSVSVPDSSMQTMGQLGRDLHDLADTALLTLYLEVRVLCLYHLQRMLAGGDGSGSARFFLTADSVEVDAEVVRLTERLEAVGAALGGALSPVTRHYVLNGAAAFSAHVLIDGVSRIERVNEHGVRRLLRSITALQHSLKQLTQRQEPSLERAHTFFQLLLIEPEAMLQQLAAGGSVFSEKQYSAVLSLMHASRPGLSANALHANMERLRDIVAGHFTDRL